MLHLNVNFTLLLDQASPSGAQHAPDRMGTFWAQTEIEAIIN
jgi:hypothetical protein